MCDYRSKAGAGGCPSPVEVCDYRVFVRSAVLELSDPPESGATIAENATSREKETRFYTATVFS